MVELKLLPAQGELLLAKERVVAVCSGVGGGKTFSACLKALELAQVNAGFQGAFLMPTFRMCKNIAFKDFLALLEKLGIKHRVHVAELKVEVFVGDTAKDAKWSTIYFLSAEKPDALNGLNLAWAIMDEAGSCKEDAWKKMLARIRAPAAPREQIIAVGTPEARAIWYKELSEGHDKVRANRTIRAKTEDNYHLSPEYLSDLRDRYTPEEFLQYCHGHFISAGGQVYRWDSSKHVQPLKNLPYPLTGSIQVYADFNVSKVVWLLAFVTGNKIHVFDEVVNFNTYTDEQAKKVKERIHSWGQVSNGVVVYHDAATSNRSATASRDRTGRSDVYWCKELGFRTKANSKNPPIRERIASVNAKLSKGELVVDPRCKELIESLSSQGRDSNGQPDKSTGLDHAVDALGYGVHWQWPIRPLQTVFGHTER